MKSLPPFVKDIRGSRHGRLVVEEFVEVANRRSKWLCRCDCGNMTTVLGCNLRKELKTKSCGCLQVEMMRAIGLVCPSGSKAPRGATKDRLQKIYRGMIDRCTNPGRNYYLNYGARGISVCQEWMDDFDSFFLWAVNNGYSESLTIDRIDNDGNYSPSNCRWADRTRQSNNTRRNYWICAFGERKSLSDWSRDPRCKVHKVTIKARIKAGMTPEIAISTPPLPAVERSNIRWGKARAAQLAP